MTAYEMVVAFSDKLGASRDKPRLVTQEILNLLNEAQLALIQERYRKHDTMSFEQNGEVIAELQPLMVSNHLVNAFKYVSDPLMADYAALPSDLMVLLSHASLIRHLSGLPVSPVDQTVDDKAKRTLTVEGVRIERRPNITANSDNILRMYLDPFNKPDIHSPLTHVSDGKIIVYTDDTFVVDKVYLTYIKEPSRISFAEGGDCKLPAWVHDDIVRRAVQIFDSTRSQTGLDRPNPASV